MKVIKRDGKIVNYDRTKIEIAINKANLKVNEEERIDSKAIKNITDYIESLNKKRMLVEDIQDIIEKKLMELRKYDLAKEYIVYRYTRTLVRKKNTTDESILGLIKNSRPDYNDFSNTKETIIAATQRDLIASEVSKDLTRRMLLPPKVIHAHQDGTIYFNDSDYFLQSICNSSYINLENMLDNGTVINNKLIETPKSFSVACTVTTQIIGSIASNQSGGISVNICSLGKYLKKSRDKFYRKTYELLKENEDHSIIDKIVDQRVNDELKSGIQTIQYQLNTLMTINGKSPIVTLYMHLKDDDPYIKENALIIEEILNQRYQGIKNYKGRYITLEVPKLIYVIDDNNNLKGNKYDYLTTLAIKCAYKRQSPSFISSKKMKENYNGNVFSSMGESDFLSLYKDKESNEYQFEGRFNQGIVTINLPRIALESNKDESTFFKLLNDKLLICKEALMCRHYALNNTTSDISPIHYHYGALARLNPYDSITSLLKEGYSTLSLGYLGLDETVKYLKDCSYSNTQGLEFAIKVVNFLKNTTSTWSKESNLGFVLTGIDNPSISSYLLNIDKRDFGIVKDVTDKPCYNGSFYLSNDNITSKERIKNESKLLDLTNGGSICKISIKELDNEFTNINELVDFIYNEVEYLKFTNNK